MQQCGHRAVGHRHQQDGQLEARERAVGADGHIHVLGRAGPVVVAGLQRAKAQVAVVAGLAAEADHADVGVLPRIDRVERELEVRELPSLHLLGVDRELTPVAPQVGLDQRPDRLAFGAWVILEQLADEPSEVLAQGVVGCRRWVYGFHRLMSVPGERRAVRAGSPNWHPWRAPIGQLCALNVGRRGHGPRSSSVTQLASMACAKLANSPPTAPAGGPGPQR